MLAATTAPSELTQTSSATLTPTPPLPPLAGHPEFHAGIVQKIIDKRESTGVFSQELAAQSRLDAEKSHDGVRIARLLLTIIGGV